MIISQTGGGCRASNYIGFIRRALKKAGYGNIPVISINLSGLEDNPGFKLTPKLILRGIYGAIFGDIFMKCVYRLRPYEAVPGSVNAMHRKWVKVCQDFLSNGYPSRRKFKRLCREIIGDFDNNIELLDIKKPRVGVVGEILVKFLPAANNYLVDLLESEGAEAVVPDLLDFLLYCFYNQNFKVEKLGFEKKKPQQLILVSKLWNGSVLRQLKHLQQASTSHRQLRFRILERWLRTSYLLVTRLVKDGSLQEKC